MIRSRCLIDFSGSLPSMNTMTLLDLRSGAIRRRLQNGLANASWKFFGPAVKLLTALTASMVWICCVSFWIRPWYRGEEMSLDDTAKMTSGWDGKRCSIFWDWRNPGSLVEKKKFSSTTGLRSTRAATSTNKATVTASISQCVPNRTAIFETVVLSFIAKRCPITKLWPVESRGRLVHHCRLNLDNFDRTFRQCRQKAPPVGLGHDSIV